MNPLILFLATCVVTAISLVIVSKLPLGVQIDSFGKALIAGIVFGILNAYLRPVLFWLTIPITLVTFGLFLFILNAIIFGLTAWLIRGFRLRWGIMSAILGAIALSIINSILFWFLGTIGVIPAVG